MSQRSLFWHFFSSMIPSETMVPLEQADADLVALARHGDADAFGQILARAVLKQAV